MSKELPGSRAFRWSSGAERRTFSTSSSPGSHEYGQELQRWFEANVPPPVRMLLTKVLGLDGWTAAHVQGWSYGQNGLLPLCRVIPRPSESADSSRELVERVSGHLQQFSVTELVVENNRPVVMRFEARDDHVYLHLEVGGRVDPVDLRDGWCNKVIERFEKLGLTRFRGSPLRAHAAQIERTVQAAFLDQLNGGTIDLITINVGARGQRVGGIVVLYREPPVKQDGDLRQLLELTVGGLLADYQMHELAQLEHEARNKAAIATVMGRVNAHDMGHVLASARLPEGSTADFYYRHLFFFQHLTSFVRRRMVFAAEASAVEPGWTLSIPLNAQIVFPFHSYVTDTKTDTHPSAVCEFLARSERVEQVAVHLYLDGKELTYSYRSDDSLWRSRSGQGPIDIDVDIPSGNIGAHALYCILENVIRNGAKYGSAQPDNPERQKLSIYIDTAHEWGSAYYQVTVVDDHSRFDAEQFSKHKSVCRFVPARARPRWANDATAEQSEDWRLVDDKGQLCGGGFGIKEMRICAAWLRTEPPAKVLNREQDLTPPLLSPLYVTANGVEHPAPEVADEPVYFGYRFYLLKPMRALFVGAAAPGIEGDLARSDIAFADHIDGIAERAQRTQLGIIDLDSIDQGGQLKLAAQRTLLPTRLILVTAKTRDEIDDQFEPCAVLPRERFERVDLPALRRGDSATLVRLQRLWLDALLGRSEEGKQLVLHVGRADPGALDAVKTAWMGASRMLRKELGHELRLIVDMEEPEPYTSSNVLVYAYHRALERKRDQFGFYEASAGTSGGQQLLFNPPADDAGRLALAFDLFEAALIRVAVLDERLWQRSCRDADLRPRLRRSGVYMPRGPGDSPTGGTPGTLEMASFDYVEPRGQRDLLREYLDSLSIDVLSIHQGILDKMTLSRAEAEDLLNELEHTSSGSKRIVVVHSDRGEGMQQKRAVSTRFVPYSAIEPWLIDPNPSKYHLVKVLLAARARA